MSITLEVATATDLRRFLARASAGIERHAAALDRLDAALGDGDHGENMRIGWRSVVEALPAGDEADVGELLRLAGHTLVASVGGASGPLYGAAFLEAGFALRGRRFVGLDEIAVAFEAGARALARRGRASVGDKTILDALDPAARSLGASARAGEPLASALTAAAAAARTGMRSTVPLVARRGLALRLGDRSRGHQDPGATSCFLLVLALARGERLRPMSRDLAGSEPVNR